MDERYYTIDEVAALLKTGRNSMLAILREKQTLNEENIPYRKYRVQGLFATRSTGLKRVQVKTVVTEKGIRWIAGILNLHNNDQEKTTEQKKRDADKEYYRRKKAEKEVWKLILCSPWTTKKKLDNTSWRKGND